MDKNKDIFGTAIKAFYLEKDTTDIIVHSEDFDDDIIPVDYLFRDFEQMPEIEQKALQLCSGKVLDVGCGAGSHALYLQEKGIQVKAIDTSIGAIEVARQRGVTNAACEDFFRIENKKYDTLLMLMNGSGIIGKLENLENFFRHAKSLLNPGGKILMDSSDLVYLFDDGVTESNSYYGELKYKVSYKGKQSDNFDWLFIDQESLMHFAEMYGFHCEIILEGDNHEYLACLNLK